jgi:poly(A) polymerase
MFFISNCAIDFNEDEAKIIAEVKAAAEILNFRVFLIGGYVRDKILNRQSKDMDFMCIGDGIVLAELIAERTKPKTKVSVFKNFGTARLLMNGMEVELVGARKESYDFDSRKPTVENGTLDDDLKRRDFTINALAIEILSTHEGILIDEFDGLKDIQRKILRTPLEPDITFSDDPLRMMRAIRFASQLQFEIHPATFNSIRHNSERIKIISAERISEEMNKIILSDKPSIGFILLNEAKILPIIFPEFVALAGAEYKDGLGHKDNFFHTLQVLDNICETTDDLWVRWAAVLHDIAKPITKKFEEGTGWTFHGHEVVGSRMVKKIFNRMRLPMNEKMKVVEKLVFLHLRPISLSKENISDTAIRRLIVEAGDDYENLMKLCNADITSKNKEKVIKYKQNFELVKKRVIEVEEKDHLRNWKPPITGDIIMSTFNIPATKLVGLIKDAVCDAILDGEIENNYESAFQYMLKKAAELGIKK